MQSDTPRPKDRSMVVLIYPLGVEPPIITLLHGSMNHGKAIDWIWHGFRCRLIG